MNGYFKLLIAAAILTVGFGAGWGVNGWRMSGELQSEKTENAKQLGDMRKRDNDALERYIVAGKKLQQERDALAAQLAAQDAKHTRELNDAKQKETDFRACVAAGKCGLRVNATCPSPATTAGLSQALAGSGVDSGASVRLTPDAQSNYFTLRTGIIEYRARLGACQDALKAITGQ